MTITNPSERAGTTRLSMDVLSILGRGIERVETRDGFAWHPTRLIERPTPQGWHSGYRAPDLVPDDPSAVVAGSNANVLAAVELYEELAARGQAPKLVVFAAGRPRYLADDPDPTLAEGRVLFDKFCRLVRHRGSPLAESVILNENRNTRDDLLGTAQLALARGYSTVGILTVSVHIERTSLMFALLRRENPALDALQVSFWSSEELLSRRYALAPCYQAILACLHSSPAYMRTLKMERRGIAALNSGAYDFSQEG